MIGKNILHYKIIEKLGEGGMGVVYKAQDTKLDRLLALKFLPPQLTVNDTDKARFLQEAKAAAAINHPNVCTIYDIMEEDKQQFIVMEYVEGQTLRQLTMNNDQLAINKIIDYALQIAAALEAAHNKGVVHRDIKSDNIMLSSTNQIKVMDFGLAKLKGSLKLTKTSSTVGTLAYMAPEQIEGKETGARADIFSFAVVLYEMLAGKLPFSGEYEAALMYNILNEDPQALENYRTDISSELVHVLNRALEKDPEDRYQNMHDVLIDLKRVKRDSSKVSHQSLKEMPLPETSAETGEVPIGKKLKRKAAWFVPVIILSMLVLLIVSFLIFNPFAGESLPPMKTVPFTSLPGVEEFPSFSPDGTLIAFSWQSFEGENINDYDIYVKLIGAGSKQLLVGGQGIDVKPAWSPDGRYIAFCRISYDLGGVSSIYIIPSRGGTERKLASVDFGSDWWWTNLSWSADSKSIAFSAMDSVKDFYRIFLLSVDSHQINELTNAPDIGLNDKYCAISPDGGNLAIVRGSRQSKGSDIYIVPMEGGEAVQLTSDNKNISGLSWTRDGSEILFGSNRGLGSVGSIWRISATGGEPRHVPAIGEDLSNPVITRQGDLLACQRWAWDENILRMEIPKSKAKKNEPSKVIYSTQLEWQAKYSPDSKKIAFVSNKSGSEQVWICDSNGENHEQLTSLSAFAGASSLRWSPDGSMITYASEFEGQKDIFTINVQGGTPFQITQDSANDDYPCYSSDANWIYFSSIRSGTWQIWKIPAQGGKAFPITNKGGHVPIESADENWLYYSRHDTMSIWKKSLPDGEETLVLNCNLINPTQWYLAEDGIYYIKDQMIHFYDFTTKDITEIAEIGKRYCYDLNVSSDQHWMLYTEAVEECDIVLVENFH